VGPCTCGKLVRSSTPRTRERIQFRPRAPERMLFSRTRLAPWVGFHRCGRPFSVVRVITYESKFLKTGIDRAVPRFGIRLARRRNPWVAYRRSLPRPAVWARSARRRMRFCWAWLTGNQQTARLRSVGGLPPPLAAHPGVFMRRPSLRRKTRRVGSQRIRIAALARRTLTRCQMPLQLWLLPFDSRRGQQQLGAAISPLDHAPAVLA
jgi:hypothetical protein